MNDCCLHLLCPLAVEERALDALLTLGGAGVFTSTPAHAHGFAHGRLSPAEQVTGRSEANLIQVLLPSDGLEALLDRLRLELPKAGVRYWVTPVCGQGELL